MAALRYIQIPENLNIVVDEVVWSFVRCLVYVVDTHPSFNQTGSGVRVGARILELFDGKNEKDVVTLDQADWKMLETAFDTPAAGYIPTINLNHKDGRKEPYAVPGRAFLRYLDAVSDEATQKMPQSKTANGVEVKAEVETDLSLAVPKVAAEQPS